MSVKQQVNELRKAAEAAQMKADAEKEKLAAFQEKIVTYEQEASRCNEAADVLEGKVVTKKPGRKRGPRTGPSVKKLVEEIMAEATEGMTLEEITDAVLHKGYKTNSDPDKFSRSVYQALHKMDDIESEKVEGQKSKVYKKVS